MKKIFPHLGSTSGHKVPPIPAPRSNTTNIQKIGGKHSERIIFVENRRKVGETEGVMTKGGRPESVGRRNSNTNNSLATIS